MFSLGVVVRLLCCIFKGLFFRVYSFVFTVLILWASLRMTREVVVGQVLVESYARHGFLVLSLWLGVLVFLIEYQGPLKSYFCRFVFVVCGVSSLAFIVGGGIVYFILFELVFVPTRALILIWGYNKERIRAVTYILTYSAFGGGFHLISLVRLDEGVGRVFLGCSCSGSGESVEAFIW